MKNKQKSEKINPLSEWEWDLTWSSLRYFCGRYTIASAMYPSDLVKNFGKRMSDDQKLVLSEEIQKQIDDAKRTNDDMWLKHDMENWSSLRNYFDKSTWREIHCSGKEIEDTVIIAFPSERKIGDTIESRWIPLDKYENSGSTSTSVNEDYIKEIKEIDNK